MIIQFKFKGEKRGGRNMSKDIYQQEIYHKECKKKEKPINNSIKHSWILE